MATASSTRAVALVLCSLLALASISSVSAMSCSQVVRQIAPCLSFIRGGELSNSCCPGVRSLNNNAKTRSERQNVCHCLKTAAAAVGGLNSGRVSQLPGHCDVHLPFSISANEDCSRIS